MVKKKKYYKENFLFSFPRKPSKSRSKNILVLLQRLSVQKEQTKKQKEAIE